jgi:ADP-heptose:LPS heptosyltransferase
MAQRVVLVFRTGQLGDSLVSLPAIRAIRAAHPDARLVLLTDRQREMKAVMSWEVFGPTGLFADVAYLSVPSRPSDYIAASKVVRAWAPSRLYYLPPMPRSRWQVARDWLFFRWLCGMSDIAGLHATGPYPVRDASGGLVRLPRESDRLLQWVTPWLARPASQPDECLAPLPDHRSRARRAIEHAGFLGHQLIAIGPGSKMQATQWPEDRFQRVGSELLRRFPDVRLVVLGAPHERELGDRLCGVWGERSINLSGDLSVWESAAVLERCSVYVGNDTGTMHLAASVGTPCAAIFSARDNPGKWEPAGDRHVVLRHDVPCGGCGLRTCIEHDLACLKGIDVDDVVAAVAHWFEDSESACGHVSARPRKAEREHRRKLALGVGPQRN